MSLAVWPALGGITLVRAGADGMKATRPWLSALIARASDDPAELSIDTLGLHWSAVSRTVGWTIRVKIAAGPLTLRKNPDRNIVVISMRSLTGCTINAAA
ncbi:hypothetical protein [Methylobacterium flocculans]|uniref:hypothetical protein n=1 Tax=Methylobacterium flocculans TaxID=2984843 RepID=UPI0021F258A8|nr:hypothetical protein [Methylobacterium sp. FF17]